MQPSFNSLGFTKGYNLALFSLLVGSLFGFVLARFSYLDFHGILCRPDGTIDASNNAAPGECFYLLRYPYKVGMILHLSSILPAAFLACFQFIPIIRHRALIWHRASGYIIVILSPISVIGALMITRHAFGGGLDAQAAIGALGILFLCATGLAYYNIKRLQIEQHRAWMLRAWVYAGSVITTRLILFAGAGVISSLGGFFTVLPCDQISWMMGGNEKAAEAFPLCSAVFRGSDIDLHAVPVQADLRGTAPEASAAYTITYGMAHWLALVIHILGVEVYLKLTSSEAERLRNVSYRRQKDAGFNNPGRSGWTADRWGDTEKWEPKTQVESVGSHD